MKSSLINFSLLFLFFYFICFVIGYASISRYDPTLVPHMDDTKYYIDIVKNGLNFNSDDPRYTRFGIPLIAHFIYKYFIFGSFNQPVFSLLLLNSLFVSLTAVSIIIISKILDLKNEVVVASLLLFFTNFTIINTYLVGYLDGFNAMIFSFLAIFLLKNNWSYKILLITFLSMLGKETILITTSIFLGSWYLYDYFSTKKINFKALKIIFFHIIIGSILIFCSKYYASTISGEFNFLQKIDHNPTYSLRNVILIPFQLGYVYTPIIFIFFSRLRLPISWYLSTFTASIIISLIALKVGFTGHGLARITFELVGIIFCILCADGFCNVLQRLLFKDVNKT